MRIVIAITVLAFLSLGSGFIGYSIVLGNNYSDKIILRDSLEQANKSTLYYRTQYLKANTQLIEIKQKCIYCAD